MKFGAHMSTSGGLHKALERGLSVQCDVVQVFVKNNMQWLGKAPTIADARTFADSWAASGLSAVFGHTGYLINLGAPASPNRDRSIQSLIQEIQFATAYRLPFLVLHPGAHLGAGEDTGIQRIIAGLDEVFAATPRSPVRLALENTAGQGSCLGYRIAHLAKIFDGVKRSGRLGLCLDTAHFFAAGYDIRRPKGWDQAIGEVEDLVGLKQILAFHLNDSKTELGSRVDRHAHIGQGHIGKAGFKHLVRDARFSDLPGCLETPKSNDLHEDAENLAVLRALARSRAASHRRRS